GYITYPRTSSQKIPPTLNVKKLFEKLSKQEKYSKIVKDLISKSKFKANEGPKSDPAHPACVPSGEIPKNLKGKESQVYDLIARRFLSSFGDVAKKENMNIKMDCNEEKFSFSCSKIIEKGWTNIYGPYFRMESIELNAKEGDEIKNPKIILYSKETQPPKRFTQASIIKELAEKNLGTKSTRALVLDTLFQRHYVQDKSIQVTNIGETVCDTLEEYVPELVSEQLTRHFEEDLEQIREDKKKKEDVINEAKIVLEKVLKKFKSNEEKIGKNLLKAVKETRAEQENLGLCPQCKKGDLVIRRGKFGRFVTCNKYPECKITFSLPSNALVIPAKKLCPECNYPVIKVIKKATRPREVCLNKECKSKEVPKEILKRYESKKCLKCQSEMIIRKSLYGSFLACSKYPKCRSIEQIKLE
ncbi:topoisomerase DNA-binding C4 zinc finger domain-containing protein, partial [Candidatus Woesearchaeota archaeon]|nr:topoisomerase DNA-binding C4 zinc finger domain-containing protein [Candidatus Woesearchaeota archaeon]